MQYRIINSAITSCSIIALLASCPALHSASLELLQFDADAQEIIQFHNTAMSEAAYQKWMGELQAINSLADWKERERKEFFNFDRQGWNTIQNSKQQEATTFIQTQFAKVLQALPAEMETFSKDLAEYSLESLCKKLQELFTDSVASFQKIWKSDPTDSTDNNLAKMAWKGSFRKIMDYIWQPEYDQYSTRNQALNALDISSPSFWKEFLPIQQDWVNMLSSLRLINELNKTTPNKESWQNQLTHKAAQYAVDLLTKIKSRLDIVDTPREITYTFNTTYNRLKEALEFINVGLAQNPQDNILLGHKKTLEHLLKTLEDSREDLKKRRGQP